ncbi:uncharacterized protein [Parasteatoda tepidariorum]|uniref:uncharacterized protein n=1 Tax=Parasteatoda tepidariorum TaxID=114398 RepID=UPI0039BC3059
MLGREDTAIARYFRDERRVDKLSLHFLSMDFFNANPDEFLSYCSLMMSDSVCREAKISTAEQVKNPLWFELRHARITASKIHEASHCNILDGSLQESILGARKIKDTKAMARGRVLESSVRKVVEKERNLKFKKCGIKLSPKFPVLGASADGVSEGYVLEIKCSYSEKLHCRWHNQTKTRSPDTNANVYA